MNPAPVIGCLGVIPKIVNQAIANMLSHDAIRTIVLTLIEFLLLVLIDLRSGLGHLSQPGGDLFYSLGKALNLMGRSTNIPGSAKDA